MNDKIRMNGMCFFAYHGCKEEEVEKGQYFEVDVELVGSLHKPATTDNLNDTCDFDQIYQIIADTIMNTRYNLLEALGEEICSRLLKQYPNKQVKLILRKSNPPVEGELESVEVEILRKSNG
ncbi:dihydroneopterin aldolase [bacterium]|nr:dihydroneopterin aldolase [bacterium]